VRRRRRSTVWVGESGKTRTLGNLNSVGTGAWDLIVWIPPFLLLALFWTYTTTYRATILIASLRFHDQASLYM
jgi:hypothetical protein